MPFQQTLSPEQVRHFHEDGYLVVANLVTPESIERFLAHERQPQPPTQRAGLRTHTVDPEWMTLASNPRTVGIVEQLLEGPARIVQTMFLNKPPAGGLGIALHQDGYYIRNEPQTLMACWVALADAGQVNGGLCVVPGSHRQGLVECEPNRDEAEHLSWETVHNMRDRSGREWDQGLFAARIDVPPDRILRLETPRGACVFFSCTLIHGSFANRSSDRPRPAFATHYVRDGTWVFRTDIQETVPVEKSQ